MNFLATLCQIVQSYRADPTEDPFTAGIFVGLFGLIFGTMLLGSLHLYEAGYASLWVVTLCLSLVPFYYYGKASAYFDLAWPRRKARMMVEIEGDRP